MREIFDKDALEIVKKYGGCVKIEEFEFIVDFSFMYGYDDTVYGYFFKEYRDNLRLFDICQINYNYTDEEVEKMLLDFLQLIDQNFVQEIEKSNEIIITEQLKQNLDTEELNDREIYEKERLRLKGLFKDDDDYLSFESLKSYFKRLVTGNL